MDLPRAAALFDRDLQQRTRTTRPPFLDRNIFLARPAESLRFLPSRSDPLWTCNWRTNGPVPIMRLPGQIRRENDPFFSLGDVWEHPNQYPSQSRGVGHTEVVDDNIVCPFEGHCSFSL